MQTGTVPDEPPFRIIAFSFRGLRDRRGRWFDAAADSGRIVMSVPKTSIQRSALYAVDFDVVLRHGRWFEFRSHDLRGTAGVASPVWRTRRAEADSFAEALRRCGFVLASDPRTWLSRRLGLPIRKAGRDDLTLGCAERARQAGSDHVE